MSGWSQLKFTWNLNNLFLNFTIISLLREGSNKGSNLSLFFDFDIFGTTDDPILVLFMSKFYLINLNFLYSNYHHRHLNHLHHDFYFFLTRQSSVQKSSAPMHYSYDYHVNPYQNFIEFLPRHDVF